MNHHSFASEPLQRLYSCFRVWCVAVASHWFAFAYIPPPPHHHHHRDHPVRISNVCKRTESRSERATKWVLCGQKVACVFWVTLTLLPFPLRTHSRWNVG